MTIRWYGDELLKLLREATPDALFEVGEAFIEEAASRAPRRTGTLAESGYVKSATRSTYKANKKHRKEIKLSDDETVAAAFAAFYARFIELGTRRRAARPFIRPTLDSFKARAGDILKAKLSVKFR